MDINTFNLLIESSISEMDRTMTEERRKSVKEELSSLGIISSDDSGDGVTYEKIMSTLEFINGAKSSFLAAYRDGIEHFFNGELNEISAMDFIQIQNMFLLSLNSGETGVDYSFPVLTDEFEMSEKEAVEERDETEYAGFSDIDSADEDREIEEGYIEETTEADKGPARPLPGSKEEEKFLKLIYGLCKGVSEGLSTEILADCYEEAIRRYGASYASCHEMAEEIYRSSIEDGYIQYDWQNNSLDLRNYVKASFTATHYDDAFVSGSDRKKSVESLQKAIVSIGTNGVTTYNLTDSDLEDLAFTGVVYADGSRKLRYVTSTAMYKADFTPDEHGILSEPIFGALKGQTCECGKCRNSATDEDAKAGAICPDCLSPVVSKEDRSRNFAVVESPIPLLSGRNELIASMLNPLEWNKDKGKDIKRKRTASWVVNAFEECSSEVFYRYTPSNKTWRICVDPYCSYVREDGEKRIYGPEGLERALVDLGEKQLTVNIKGKQKTIPMAIANALQNIQYAFKKLEVFYKADTEEDTRKKSAALLKYNNAVNYYSAIKSMLEERKGRPADFLLHYLLIIPPDARPINDRNGRTDYGEMNKAYLELLPLMNLMKALKDSRKVTQPEWHKMENDFTRKYRNYITLARDKISKKNGIWYSKLQTAKSDECIRDVITPSDHLEGQEWLYKHSNGKIDVPVMDLIGLPRASARVMYKDEILAKLTALGKETGEKYTKDEINILFEVPAGTWETDENGNRERCLIDRLLDEVIINDGKGQLVLYSRQPIISNGSYQAGYAYLTDSNDISLAVSRAKPMNADYDGDTILVAKVTGAEGREELKRLMNRTMVHDATGKLMVGPQNEAVYGLYKASQPAETYVFPATVLINKEELAVLEQEGMMKNGKLMVSHAVQVNHVVEELTGAEIKIPLNKIVKAGTVYAVKDGKKIKAEEAVMLKEADGRIFAVTPLNDYVMVPKGSDVTDKTILNGGEKIARVYSVIEDKASILAGMETGLYAYNQPVTVEYEDGTEKETTPARLMLETIVGHELPFKESGLKKKEWDSLIMDEMAGRGREEGKKICSLLTHFGFKIIEDFGGGIKLEAFPTTASVSMEDIYREDDERVAHGAVFGHPDIDLSSYTLKDSFKKAATFIRKGQEYALDSNGHGVTAEYDMRIFTDNGKLCAYDCIYETGRFELLFELEDKIAECKEDNLRVATYYKRLLTATYDKMKNEEYAYINKLRAERTEEFYKENGERVINQLWRYKNNYLADSIKAGVKGESLAKGMIDIPFTKDYLGDVMNIAGGSTATGLTATERSSNESTAVINGNKTTDVAELGGIGNEKAATMAELKYVSGDCGTESYRERELTEDSVKKLQKELDGRTIARDIIVHDGEILAHRGDTFTPELIENAYIKGVRTLRQRTAQDCRCNGVCEACAGRIRGNTPEIGSSIGISAKNAFFEDLSQKSMNRAKIEGGSQMEKESEVVQKIFNGATINQFIPVPGRLFEYQKAPAGLLADRLSDELLSYASFETLPPLFAELMAKSMIQYIDSDTQLPLMLNTALNLGRDIRSTDSQGLVNPNIGLQVDSEMSYMAKDKEFSKFGAFSYGDGCVAPVRHDTELEKNKKKIMTGMQVNGTFKQK